MHFDSNFKFLPKDPVNNIPALVQIMAWRRPGDKPLSEPMMASLPTHICVTRPQLVNIDYCEIHTCTTYHLTHCGPVTAYGDIDF